MVGYLPSPHLGTYYCVCLHLVQNFVAMQIDEILNTMAQLFITVAELSLDQKFHKLDTVTCHFV